MSYLFPPQPRHAGIVRNIAQCIAVKVLFLGILAVLLGFGSVRVIAAMEQQPGALVVLRLDPQSYTTRVRAPESMSGAALRTRTATINVTYTGFTPEAQAAFQAAVDYWETTITSSVPIMVTATWEPLGAGILGQSGPTTLVRDFTNCPRSGTWYNIAEANAIAGQDLNSTTAEISADFSSAWADWYFGTDGNTPIDKIDFMSVVMHELGHGFGIMPTFSKSGNRGLWGINNYASVYDGYVVNGSGTQLISISNGSTLGSQLTSNDLYWNGAHALAANGGVMPKLYAPSTWSSGSSVSHLDEAAYPAGNPNSLMTPMLGRGESIHDLGPLATGMFQDMDWSGMTIPSPPQPDLVIQSLSALPLLTANQEFNVTVVVKNQGQASAGPFSVDLYRQSTLASTAGTPGDFTQRVSSLAAGGATIVAFSNVSYAQNGSYRLWVLTDSAGEVPEMDELNNAGPADGLAVAVGPQTTIFVDNFESSAPGWTHSSGSGTDTWALVTNGNAHSATHCWFAQDPAKVSDQYLVSPAITLPAVGPFVLSFWHTFALETAWDGGLLEISTDNGASYAGIDAEIISGPYSYEMPLSYGNPIGGRLAWSGGTIGAMSEVLVNLSGYEGRTIKLRWRLGSDNITAGTGWYVDDVVLRGPASNTSPTISDIPNRVIDEDGTTGPLPFTIGDAQTAASELLVTMASSDTTLVPESGMVLGGSGANRTITVTPAANLSGTTTITITVSDGELMAVDNFVLTVTPVNDAPVAADDSYTTNEDSTLTVPAPGVLANDTDVDSAIITAVKVTDPSHGALTLHSDGSFSYTPFANYYGSDTFTYLANDGLLNSNVATVNITVNPVNDAPVAVDDSYSTNEDSTLTVPAPGVLANDTDVDHTTLTVVKVTDPSHGALTLHSDGSFSYTPVADYYGSDSFTYKANDGLLNSNIATVNITVIPVNDAPVAVDDSFTTNEDSTLTVPAPGVLANDTDVDSPTLTVVKVTDPSHGTLTLHSDGSFSYTPAADYFGPDSFTYLANDGLLTSNVATVNITVTPVNDAPVAVDDSYTIDEDSTLTVPAPGVLTNDTDVDSAIITVVKVTDPSHGVLTLNSDGSFSYTPVADYYGPDSFTYLANDGLLNSNVATVNITVNEVNRYLADLSLRPATDPNYTGINIYSLDGATQTVAQSVAKNVKATYFVQVQNNGKVPDVLILTGTAAPAGWTGVYKSGSTVITGQITGTGWSTPVLAVGETAIVTFEITPGSTVLGGTVATQTITITSSSDSSKRDVGVMKTTVPVVNRPDLYLRPSTVTTYSGSGVYNLDGSNQTVGLSVANGVKATYYVTVKNNGNVPEAFTITGPSAPAGWTVTYNAGATVITGAVTTTGWTTPVLNPAATVLITVYVTPSSKLIGGAVVTQRLTVTSNADPSKQDVGVINTTLPVLNRPDLFVRPSTVTSYIGSGVYNLDGTNQTVGLTVANGVKATYYVTVRNTGNVADTFTITGPIAPSGWTVEYKLGATVITGAVTTTGWTTPLLNPTATVLMTVYVTPSSGTFGGVVATQTITVTSNSDPTKQDVGVLNTTLPVVIRPDLQLRPSTVTTYIGSGVYNLDGANQTVGLTVANGAKATYFITLKNNGNIPDTFTITGPAAPVGWTVTYNYGATIITDAVTTTGWVTPVLNPAATILISIYVTPGSSTIGGTVVTQTMTVTSGADPAKQDVGVLNTTLSVVNLPDLRVRPSTVTSYIGGGIYNLDGTNQTVGLSVANGVKATYYVTVKNNGNAPEAFIITGSPAPEGWTVAYNIGATVITGAVTSTGWTTPVLNPAASLVMTVFVTPGSTVPVGAVATQMVTVTSSADPTKQDVGVLQTTVM